MFYDLELLCRGGRFGLVWIAGTRGAKALSLGEVRNVNVIRTCDEILSMVVTSSRNPKQRLSLYLSSKLFLGVVRVHFRQAELLLEATLRALSKIRKPLLFSEKEKEAADLKEKRRQRKRKITEDVTVEVQPAVHISDSEVINILEQAAAHIAQTDQITLPDVTDTGRALDEFQQEFNLEEDINIIQKVLEQDGDIITDLGPTVAPEQLDQIVVDTAAVETTPAVPEVFVEPAGQVPIAEAMEEVVAEPQPKRPYAGRKKKGNEIPFITTKKRTTKKLTKEVEYHNPALMLDENENLLMSSCFRYPSLFDKFVVNELNIYRDSDLAQGTSSKSLSLPRASQTRLASLEVITPETSKEEVSSRQVTVLPSVIEETAPPFIGEQIPGPIETDILPMETAPSEPVYMESPTIEDRDQSPSQANVRQESRLIEMAKKVRRWYSENDAPLRIDDIAEKPLTRLTVALAFFNLLDLHKRGYVVLKSLKDSIELDIIELGPKLLV